MAYAPQDGVRWRVPRFGSLFSRPLIFANAGCQFDIERMQPHPICGRNIRFTHRNARAFFNATRH